MEMKTLESRESNTKIKPNWKKNEKGRWPKIPDWAEDKIGEPENEDGKGEGEGGGEEEGSGGEEGEGTGCGQGAEDKEGEVGEDKNGEGDDRIEEEEEVVVVAEPTAVAGEEARARETETGKDDTGTGRETMELAVWEAVVAGCGGDGDRPWRVAVVS